MTSPSMNMFLFACLALLAAADEEKRILLNDPDLIHSEITAMQHQIQEMNAKLLDQQNKLVEQERFNAEIQKRTQSGIFAFSCLTIETVIAMFCAYNMYTFLSNVRYYSLLILSLKCISSLFQFLMCEPLVRHRKQDR